MNELFTQEDRERQQHCQEYFSALKQDFELSENTIDPIVGVSYAGIRVCMDCVGPQESDEYRCHLSECGEEICEVCDKPLKSCLKEDTKEVLAGYIQSMSTASTMEDIVAIRKEYTLKLVPLLTMHRWPDKTANCYICGKGYRQHHYLEVDGWEFPCCQYCYRTNNGKLPWTNQYA